MKLDLNRLGTEPTQLNSSKQSIIPDSIAELSSFVKSCRKEKKITQEELATFANISRLAISEFENGKSDIKFSTLIKILKACGLDIEVRER